MLKKYYINEGKSTVQFVCVHLVSMYFFFIDIIIFVIFDSRVTIVTECCQKINLVAPKPSEFFVLLLCKFGRQSVIIAPNFYFYNIIIEPAYINTAVWSKSGESTVNGSNF